MFKDIQVGEIPQFQIPVLAQVLTLHSIRGVDQEVKKNLMQNKAQKTNLSAINMYSLTYTVLQNM